VHHLVLSRAVVVPEAIRLVPAPAGPPRVVAPEQADARDRREREYVAGGRVG
jgi:hypothetical protein